MPLRIYSPASDVTWVTDTLPESIYAPQVLSELIKVTIEQQQFYK